MSKPARKRRSPGADASKPGSNPPRSDNPRDFGVPTDAAHAVERQYVSENTRASDRGAAQPRSSELQGNRTGGAGGNYSGPGSSSGGDLDPDIIGIGTGGGVSASGSVHEPAGPDDTDGTSDAFASGPHARGRNTGAPPRTVRGSTVTRPSDADVAAGADSTGQSDLGDDAAAGEVSSDEASGRNDRG